MGNVGCGIALLLAFSAMDATLAEAAPIVVNTGIGITVSGDATFAGGVWEYRYTLTETIGLAADPTRFIINEAPVHAGVHHETGFISAGGTFQYDFNALGFGLSAHNYFWNDLPLMANGALTVGFDDIHGPTFEKWGIQASGHGMYVEANPNNYLPVPAPEPGSMFLLGGGLLALFRWRRGLHKVPSPSDAVTSILRQVIVISQEKDGEIRRH